MPYEVETLVIGGIVQRVYKNLWTSLREFWLWSCDQYGPKDYIVHECSRFSYNDTRLRSVNAAAMLRDRYDIQKGDRIVICSANIPQYLVAFWACQLIGAIPVLVNM